jgi:hypothetical protein
VDGWLAGIGDYGAGRDGTGGKVGSAGVSGHLFPAACHCKALFTSPVFLPPKDVEICGDLVNTKSPHIPSNTLPQKYSIIM